MKKSRTFYARCERFRDGQEHRQMVGRYKPLISLAEYDR